MIFLFSCKNNITESKIDTKKNSDSLQVLKKFYYPLDSLEEGLVYEFVDDSTGYTYDYWLYKTVKDDAGDKFLIGTGYDAFFEQRYFSREWIVANGTLQKDYLFMQLDSVTGKSVVRPSTIVSDALFPFNPTNDSSMAYRYRIKFSLLPDTALQYDLIKDRRFDSYSTFKFNGKELRTAVFKINEKMEAADITKDGGHWDLNSDITEIYAEGIGLVYKERKSKVLNSKVRLKRIMSVEEFQKIQKSQNN
jgi:hypothetical protein